MKKIRLFRNISPWRTKISLAPFGKFCQKINGDWLVYIGTIITFVEQKTEKHFRIKHSFLYVIACIVSIFTWTIFFLVSDKKPEKTETKKQIQQLAPSKPSLFPLADYYLFDNEPHIDKTDLVVKPKFKLENNAVKKDLLKNLDKAHRLFTDDDKIIKKEMSKLNK